jgi:hypothetical protein
MHQETSPTDKERLAIRALFDATHLETPIAFATNVWKPPTATSATAIGNDRLAREGSSAQTPAIRRRLGERAKLTLSWSVLVRQFPSFNEPGRPMYA